MITQERFTWIIFISLILLPVQAQKRGMASIKEHDLKMHMEFLASDELEGRSTGEPGLNVAARYLAVQARALGLQSADSENGYFQYYSIVEREYDWESSNLSVETDGKDPVINKENFFLFPWPKENSLTIEGEVIFAGYGIKSDEDQYNDFEHIDIKDKVVLIMSRSPMNDKGTEAQFGGNKRTDRQNYQHKMDYIIEQHPLAVLHVYDPKSGFNSILDVNPELVRHMNRSRSLKLNDSKNPAPPDWPKMVMIHRSVADQLLKGSGKNLEELQQKIDADLSPQSFLIDDVRIRIELNMKVDEMVVPNVFGMIEGIDPVLKDEVIIYSAHFDHIGSDGHGGIYNGADDNASGTVALIEIAEAFMKEKSGPKRSVGFLWVSGEEIGLFGSEYFAENPMVPENSISAVINLDMVGRRKTEEDENSERHGLTVAAGDTIKVIGGKQSKVLMDINKKTLEEMEIPGNFEYNDLNHPERYFFRSDHFSFVKKDIPVLFYSTGTHVDYHRLSDTADRLDYDKFLKVTRFCYKAGFNIARYEGVIEVDNPYSSW